MSNVQDGPRSSLFVPIAFKGNVPLARLTEVGISDNMSAALEHTPSGDCVAWGIPFEIGDVVVITDLYVLLSWGTPGDSLRSTTGISGICPLFYAATSLLTFFTAEGTESRRERKTSWSFPLRFSAFSAVKRGLFHKKC